MALAAIAVVIFAGSAFAVSRSSLFRVRHIEVTGASHLTRKQVVGLSGLTTNANVLWFDPGAVELRLEEDPWIAHAAVSRKLPWTVRIEVAERQPVATAPGPGGFLLIAGDGTVLGEVGADPHLPAIVLPPRSLTFAPLPGLAGPAEAVGGLDPRIRSRIDRAVVSTDGTIELYLAGGMQVDFGGARQIAAKSRAITSILRWARAEGRRLATINVVAPDAPAASLVP